MKKPISKKDVDNLTDRRTDKLIKVLHIMDSLSGPIGTNMVLNVADVIARKDEIEKELGEELDYGRLFKALASSVMNGGVIVMTDESTTGSAVSVEFRKEVKF